MAPHPFEKQADIRSSRNHGIIYAVVSARSYRPDFQTSKGCGAHNWV